MKVAVFGLVVLVAALALVLHKAEAAEYVVGDEVGWTVPHHPHYAATFYAWWASSHNFLPEDIIVFKSSKKKRHDEEIAYVSGEDYKNCNSSNPIALYNAPYNFIPHVPGTYLFISSIAKHCQKGQKIAIYVAHQSATTPATQPSPHYPHVPTHPPVYPQVPAPPPV